MVDLHHLLVFNIKQEKKVLYLCSEGGYYHNRDRLKIMSESIDESATHYARFNFKSNSNLSNIIICIYADNTVGNDLAMGFKSKHSIIEQSRVWLAMYSYNMVEGKYFDDNPGGYLGAY